MERCITSVFIIVMALILVSCGTTDSISPDASAPDRVTQSFPPPVVVFPGPGEEGIYYDVDVSEILQGPGPGAGPDGTVWEDGDGHNWAVAVALEETGDPGTTDRMIRYRFLGDNINTMSPEFEITDYEGNLRFARVAACSFYHSSYPNDTNYTFVEVTIVFQRWRNGQWEIVAHRMGFDPDDFTDIGNMTGPVWEAAAEVFYYTLLPYGQMMPDVAYDPRDGDLYAVFTRYMTAYNAHVHARKANRQGVPRNVSWLDTWRVQPSGDHDGFHPRIDLGLIGFGGPQDWMVGVAYTGEDLELGAQFHVRLCWWAADTWPPEPAGFPLRIEPYENQAAGMPTIDIGPPGTNNGAIAWTQSRGEGWNDVTVAFLDTHGAHFFFHENSGLIASASPSVAVWDTHGFLTYQTSISYLQTQNPNSLLWNPRARQVNSNLNQPEHPVYSLLGEISISNTIHGDFDSGSQYSNW